MSAPTAGRGPIRRGGGPMMGVGAAEKSSNFKGSARRMVGLLRPYRAQLAVVVLLTILSASLNVAAPKVLGQAVDKVFTGAISMRLPAGASAAEVIAGLRRVGNSALADVIARSGAVPGQRIDFGAVGQILLVVLLLYVAAALCQLVQARMLNRVVNRTVQQLRRDIEDKVHRLPLSYLDGQPRGELLSRVTNDIDNIGQSMQQTISQLLMNGLLVIGVVAMMFTISWWMTLAAMIAIPVVMIVTGQVMKRSQRLFVQQWRGTGDLNAQIEETYSAYELVKVFGRGPQVQAGFAAKNDRLMDVSYKAQFISSLVMPIMMFVGNLQYVLVCVLGGLQVAAGNLSLGQVTAFVQYTRQFTQPLTQLASMVNLVQSGVASAERVFEVLDAPEQTAELRERPDAEHGRVTFEHVSFSYTPDNPLIEDLNLVVEPGQTIAIVGPTGAGKTTLVNLLMRFYELTSGRITLDGVDISCMPRAQLRSQIGMVLQDTWLFQGSIYDNIAYGNREATPQLVREAAQATFVDRFVHSLPAGYDTQVDEDGTNLSAGERQLVTLARAFVSDPTVLILDEATSSVDTRTELMLQQAMAALRSDRTSFVIAHRLSTIRDADTILVMEHGRIVEQGDHEDLLARQGAYYRLYMAQFEGAAVGEQTTAHG